LVYTNVRAFGLDGHVAIPAAIVKLDPFNVDEVASY
jgi:hypothetical protein